MYDLIPYIASALTIILVIYVRFKTSPSKMKAIDYPEEKIKKLRKLSIVVLILSFCNILFRLII